MHNFNTVHTLQEIPGYAPVGALDHVSMTQCVPKCIYTLGKFREINQVTSKFQMDFLDKTCKEKYKTKEMKITIEFSGLKQKKWTTPLVYFRSKKAKVYTWCFIGRWMVHQCPSIVQNLVANYHLVVSYLQQCHIGILGHWGVIII